MAEMIRTSGEIDNYDFCLDGVASVFSNSVWRGIELGRRNIGALNHSTGGILAYHARPYKVEDGIVVEDHTGRVFGFTLQLIQALEHAGVYLSGYEKGAAMLDAIWHDVCMFYTVALVDMAGCRIKQMQRPQRENEQKSADTLVAFMCAENRRACRLLYSPALKALAHESIMLTVPVFIQGGIEQAITERTPLAARLVPLADLGDPGLTGTLRTALFLLFETYPQVGDAVFQGSWQKHLEPGLLEAIRRFINFQQPFVLHRESRLTQDLAGLPWRAQEALRAEFSHFSEFGATAGEIAQRVHGMSFPEVVLYLRSFVV